MSFALPRGGNIYLSDIAFVRPSLGDNRSIHLPFVRLMEDMLVVSTGLEQEVEIEVTLSEASSSRVSMRVDLLIEHRIQGFMDFNVPLVFEPGERSNSVTFLIPAGGFRGFATDMVTWLCPVRLQALSNALFDRNRGWLLVTPFP
jgi:hypothetical protein